MQRLLAAKRDLRLPQELVWPVTEDRVRVRWHEDSKLIVQRWVDAPGWQRSPEGDGLEIKGALLGLDQTEHLPGLKRDRACRLHNRGYT